MTFTQADGGAVSYRTVRPVVAVLSAAPPPAPGVVVAEAGGAFPSEIPKGLQRRGEPTRSAAPLLGSRVLDAQLASRERQERVAVDRLLWIVVGGYAGFKAGAALGSALGGALLGGLAGHLVAERISRSAA